MEQQADFAVMSILPVPHNSFEVDFGTPFDKETIQVKKNIEKNKNIGRGEYGYSQYLYIELFDGISAPTVPLVL
jgi:hypothetical protein